MTGDAVLIGTTAALATGAATGLGGVAVAAMGRSVEQRQSQLMGFAAGVMLAAALFSLILPGFHALRAGGHDLPSATLGIAAAVAIGGVVMLLMSRAAHALHWGGGGLVDIASAADRRVWLFIAAITLHNFPEGLAVGVAYGSGDMAVGASTALGIGLQNIPEGIAVAAALLAAGHSIRFAGWTALASGMVEPVGGLIGAGLVTLSAALLPWGLGFAAGAMLWIVIAEILPDLARRLETARAAPALGIGVALMTVLDLGLAA